MVVKHDPNSPAEDRATTGGYPQINLNTGISVGVFALLVGMVIWTTLIKSDVEQVRALINFHEQRLTAAEATIKETRTAYDNFRYAQSQSEIKLEGRLTTIEGLLRDLLSRRTNP